MKNKNILKRKIYFSILALIPMMIMFIIFNQPEYRDTSMDAAALGGGAVLVYYIISSIRGLKNPKAGRKMEIQSTDERILLLSEKAAYWGLNVTLILTLIAAATAYYFHYDVIAMTLMAVLGVQVTIYLSCYVILNKLK